jgi:hypothetical protein
VLFGIYHHTTNEMVQLAVAAGVDVDRLFEVMTAKGAVADRWTDLWARDRVELVGTQSATNPRAAIGGFASWLWPLAGSSASPCARERAIPRHGMPTYGISNKSARPAGASR